MMGFGCVNALDVHGVALRYRLPFRGKGGNSRTYFNSALIRQLDHPVKEYLPLFDLWSGGEIKLIVADFDRLPDDFCSEHWCLDEKILWEDFRKYLHYQYGRHGLLLTSPSGKAKVIFKVMIPADIEMTETIAIDTLESLLEKSDFEVIDRSATAARLLFVNSGMYRVMVSRLGCRPIMRPVLDCLDGDGSPGSCSEHRWQLLSSSAPELDLLDGMLDKDVQWFLARFLGGDPVRAKECIGLSQPYLAKQSAVSLKKALSQRSLSEGIAALIAKGLLSVIDERYAPGKRSKLYRVENVLRVVMDLLIQKRTSREGGRRPVFLDEDIPDGAWDGVLWRATNYFPSEKAYLEWAAGKKGIGENRRYKKACSAWKCHIDSKFN